MGQYVALVPHSPGQTQQLIDKTLQVAHEITMPDGRKQLRLKRGRPRKTSDSRA